MNWAKSGVQLEFLKEAFPSYLYFDVAEVIDKIKLTKTYHNHLPLSYLSFRVINDGQVYLIPERIYNKEINNYDTLTKLQKNILSCIYTRSSDGFVREKHIKNLIENDKIEEWMYPFLYKICDEYIISILQIFYANRYHICTNQFIKFIKENPSFVQVGYDRMTSYWDCYHRHKYPKLTDYVGYKIYHDCFEFKKY